MNGVKGNRGGGGSLPEVVLHAVKEPALQRAGRLCSRWKLLGGRKKGSVAGAPRARAGGGVAHWQASWFVVGTGSYSRHRGERQRCVHRGYCDGTVFNSHWLPVGKSLWRGRKENRGTS